MNIMKMFVVVALLVMISSHIAGITSMATDREIGHLSSAQWMQGDCCLVRKGRVD